MKDLLTPTGLKLVFISFAVGLGLGVLASWYIAYTLVEQGVLK